MKLLLKKICQLVSGKKGEESHSSSTEDEVLTFSVSVKSMDSEERHKLEKTIYSLIAKASVNYARGVPPNISDEQVGCKRQRTDSEEDCPYSVMQQDDYQLLTERNESQLIPLATSEILSIRFPSKEMNLDLGYAVLRVESKSLEISPDFYYRYCSLLWNHFGMVVGLTTGTDENKKSVVVEYGEKYDEDDLLYFVSSRVPTFLIAE